MHHRASRASRRWSPSRTFWLAALLATSSAHAVQLEGASAPLELTDGKVTSGSRTLWLPAGHWYLVNRSEGSVSDSMNRSAPSDVAVLALVENGQLAAMARVAILRADVAIKNWVNTPCSVRPEEVYRRDRGGMSGQPDCLSITGQRAGEIDTYIGERFSRESLHWLAVQGIRLPEYTVSILYARYATNTFGSVLVLAPADRFQSADAAVDWAEGLRSGLKSMFEHRDSEARLEALPPRPGEGTGGEPASP